jgi:hypothetical protein
VTAQQQGADHDGDDGESDAAAVVAAEQLAREDQRADHDQSDGDPVAASPTVDPLLTDGAFVTFIREEEPCGGVEEEAGPADERQHDEGNAEDDGVDVEVVTEAAADAGDNAVGTAALQPAPGRGGGWRSRGDVVLAG